MIDCPECRKLIDSDLEEPLDPQDRAAVANHLRECPACVTYRKDRLKNSSILRHSVDRLTQQVERREAAAPPPPPPRPSLLPWFATAVILIGAAIGIIIFFKMPSPEDDPVFPSDEATGTTRPTAAAPRPGPRPERPGPGAGKSTSTRPARPRQNRIHIQGTVSAPDGHPAPRAQVILSRSDHPISDCVITRTTEDGAFSFQVDGPLPVHLNAWTATAVCAPITVSASTPVRLALRPGHRIEGRLTPDGNLDPATLRVTARWGRFGRSLSNPAADGSFTLTVPGDAAVELRPHREGLRTFSFAPNVAVTIPPGHAAPVRLRAVPGRILLVSVFRNGQPLPPNTSPDLIAALAPSGDEAPRHLTPAPDRGGAFLATVPPGAYQVVVRLRGYLESVQHASVQEYALLTVPLVRSESTVSGRFRRIGGGDADLPAAAVILRYPPLFPHDPGLRTTVGADGRFVVDGIPFAQMIVETEAAIPRRFGPFNAGTEADLPLMPGAGLEGVVRGANGQALANVLLTAETPTGKAFGKTDKDGRFGFTGLPAGTVYLYPSCELVRFEAIPALREHFRVDLPPSVTVPKDLLLADASSCRVRVRDPGGHPVIGMVILKTEAGEPVQIAAARPLDPGRPESRPGLLLPPLRAGTYQADVVEGEVHYPLGKVQLPGELDLVVRRDCPRLRLAFKVAPAARRGRAPLRLELRSADGRTISRQVLPQPRDLEIGGLAAGDYEVRATRGAARARGLFRIGAVGEAEVRISLLLR